MQATSCTVPVTAAVAQSKSDEFTCWGTNVQKYQIESQSPYLYYKYKQVMRTSIYSGIFLSPKAHFSKKNLCPGKKQKTHLQTCTLNRTKPPLTPHIVMEDTHTFTNCTGSFAPSVTSAQTTFCKSILGQAGPINNNPHPAASLSPLKLHLIKRSQSKYLKAAAGAAPSAAGWARPGLLRRKAGGVGAGQSLSQVSSYLQGTHGADASHSLAATSLAVRWKTAISVQILQDRFSLNKFKLRGGFRYLCTAAVHECC